MERRPLKVKELIFALNSLEQDLPVIYSCDVERTNFSFLYELKGYGIFNPEKKEFFSKKGIEEAKKNLNNIDYSHTPFLKEIDSKFANPEGIKSVCIN